MYFPAKAKEPQNPQNHRVEKDWRDSDTENILIDRRFPVMKVPKFRVKNSGSYIVKFNGNVSQSVKSGKDVFGLQAMWVQFLTTAR